MNNRFVVCAILAGALCACETTNQPPNTIRVGATFADNSGIPATYTCDAENMSPGISWTDLPEGTQSLAVVMSDLSADDFTHWIVYDIPINSAGIPERSGPLDGQLAMNDFNDMGYGGPCPPEGEDAHRYLFRVLALDTVLSLPAGSTDEQVLEALEGHILAQGRLIGTYQRN